MPCQTQLRTTQERIASPLTFQRHYFISKYMFHLLHVILSMFWFACNSINAKTGTTASGYVEAIVCQDYFSFFRWTYWSPYTTDKLSVIKGKDWCYILSCFKSEKVNETTPYMHCNGQVVTEIRWPVWMILHGRYKMCQKLLIIKEWRVQNAPGIGHRHYIEDNISVR